MNTSPTSPADLPELTDARLDDIERAVFSRIASDRGQRRSRRNRWWIGGAAAAAVVVVAAVIAPSVVRSVSFSGSAGSVATESTYDQPAAAPGVEGAESLENGAGAQSLEDAAGTTADATREITTTASATVTVTDAAEAARAIGEDAEARGGYVESVNVDATAVSPSTGASSAGGSMIDPYLYPPVPGGGFIAVRVPSAELDGALAALATVGEVTVSTLGRQDVTDQAVDLRARVAASEASVVRLTELIGQAQSVADLIAAEAALAERQATLESDRQQLEMLENQVALSTLTVQLVPVAQSVEADPAGFGDGIAAGWNGLIATLNGIVIALGFLLPWIVVLAVSAALIWGVARLLRRMRGGRRVVDSPAPDGDR